MGKSAAICATCGQSLAWHEAHPETMHKFGSPLPDDAPDHHERVPDRSGTDSGTQQSKRMMTDAPLRVLLIQKGIIRPDELAQYEQMLLLAAGQGTSIRVETPHVDDDGSAGPVRAPDHGDGLRGAP